MFQRLIAPLLLVLSVFASPVVAQVAGQVVDVRQSAQIVSGGASRTISVGTEVANGDTIRTGGSGQVQIRFIDETKIVVGPNSTLKIDQTLFRENGTARKFATTAVGGTFRFISGKSPKQVYKLGTPLATMGIRGTSFDYTVTSKESTDLLVFTGVVRLCAAGRRCAQVPGGCQAVAVGPDGGFSQPLTTADKRALLAQRFPLLNDQQTLQPPFRTSAAGCGDADTIALPSPAGQRERNTEPTERENPADGPSDGPDDGGNPAE